MDEDEDHLELGTLLKRKVCSPRWLSYCCILRGRD